MDLASRFRVAWRDRIFVISSFSALLLLSLQVILLLWRGQTLGLTKVNFALHYNVFFGIDAIGDWREIFWLPTRGLIFLVINNLLASWLFTEERLLSYLLLVGAVVVELALLAAAFFVLLVNL